MLRRLVTRIDNLSPREMALAAMMHVISTAMMFMLIGMRIDADPRPFTLIVSAMTSALGYGTWVGFTVFRHYASKADRGRFRLVNLDVGKSVERSNTLGLITTARRRVLLNHELTREQRIGAHAALTELAAAIEAGEHDNRETGAISPDAFAGSGEVQR